MIQENNLIHHIFGEVSEDDQLYFLIIEDESPFCTKLKDLAEEKFNQIDSVIKPDIVQIQSLNVFNQFWNERVRLHSKNVRYAGVCDLKLSGDLLPTGGIEVLKLINTAGNYLDNFHVYTSFSLAAQTQSDNINLLTKCRSVIKKKSSRDYGFNDKDFSDELRTKINFVNPIYNTVKPNLKNDRINYGECTLEDFPSYVFRTVENKCYIGIKAILDQDYQTFEPELSREFALVELLRILISSNYKLVLQLVHSILCPNCVESEYYLSLDSYTVVIESSKIKKDNSFLEMTFDDTNKILVKINIFDVECHREDFTEDKIDNIRMILKKIQDDNYLDCHPLILLILTEFLFLKAIESFKNKTLVEDSLYYKIEILKLLIISFSNEKLLFLAKINLSYLLFDLLKNDIKYKNLVDTLEIPLIIDVFNCQIANLDIDANECDVNVYTSRDQNIPILSKFPYEILKKNHLDVVNMYFKYVRYFKYNNDYNSDSLSNFIIIPITKEMFDHSNID